MVKLELNLTSPMSAGNTLRGSHHHLCDRGATAMAKNYCTLPTLRFCLECTHYLPYSIERTPSAYAKRLFCNKSCSMRYSRRTHGMSKTPLFKVWSSMRERCRNPKCPQYPNYGGRGITICERWQTFEAFFQDMHEGYAAGLMLDRIDNDGPYSPENCRWASRIVSENNKRSNHRLTLNNETHTIAEWARIKGLTPSALQQRIASGLTIQDALTQPPRIRKLSAETVREIRALEGKFSQHAIGRMYGLYQSEVRRIFRREIYAKVL